ncbi:NAD(P)-dependent oxidoreductase [Pseudonocardia sp. RS010]|uniref:NAD(P)-dependent oxidoreductase n=1 Tax=Pseudonocardia sp. RS010 TaxID=3385979 RepID=UPI00399FD501
MDTSFGWLGTGRMGTAMATRMMEARVELAVWNRTAAKCGPLVEAGAIHAVTLDELAHRDVVLVCVTRSEDLIEVLSGEGGLLTHEHRPRVVVDCSTVSAEASAQARAAAEERGAAFLAAPISGNPDMIREGAAALVASGPREIFDELHEVFSAIAPTVVYAGKGEEARLVKICHNLLLGVLAQAYGEVTSLAEKAGVAPEDFVHFIDGSVLGSPWLRHKGRAIAARDYTPTFSTRNLRKDFDIGVGAAREHEVPMPLTASTQQLIQTAIGRGFGEVDYVSLYEVQAASAGLREQA